MQLRLKVALGNEAMQNVVEAKNAIETSLLKHLELREHEGGRSLVIGDEGTIIDLNGNTVGRWAVVDELEVGPHDNVLTAIDEYLAVSALLVEQLEKYAGERS